jgi:hypothetical protein
MSTIGKATEVEQDSCYRECNGDICAKYLVTSITSGSGIGTTDNWNYQPIEGPTINKKCNKSLDSKADTKLSSKLKQKLAEAFEAKINALINGGYFLERKSFKICATFQATINVDNGEPTINITEFIVNVFGL